MTDLVSMILFLAGWVLLQSVILPRLGVST
ncbi:hypothetical protein AMOR_12490 [Anaeromyxobacter oryzae]|uniref:Uncharacterized protein n=1 Tax=Anaeromyxobacter oryzae TaxID=2918170 RepID=A0ABN6MRA8_9BACT|nr:hypothetical protein AMOR_12490 [Anaeromyxobacter oryzae]